MRSAMKEIEFTQPTEERSYKVFPEVFENDPNVFFHGTSEEAAKSIMLNGFQPQGELKSSSFAKNSSYPLGYACTKRGMGNRGAILAVKFERLDEPGIRLGVDFLYLDNQQIQPEVIAYCYIPSHYRHI
jgi:hypothetical protein